MDDVNIDIGDKLIISMSLTKEQVSMLDLMSLSHQVSRSMMIARLLTLHSTPDAFVKEIAERVTANYCEKNVEFEKYLSSARIWLEQKKINQYHIERIIQEVINNYGQN